MQYTTINYYTMQYTTVKGLKVSWTAIKCNPVQSAKGTRRYLVFDVPWFGASRHHVAATRRPARGMLSAAAAVRLSARAPAGRDVTGCGAVTLEGRARDWSDRCGQTTGSGR